MNPPTHFQASQNGALFDVTALHDDSTLCRILGLFTVNGLLLDAINAVALTGDMQRIQLSCPTVSPERAAIIRAKIGQIITVQSSNVSRLSVAA